jgi:hypothetical protein
LRNIADENPGVANLHPGAPDENPELRRLMLRRAVKLERLGLAEPVGLARWTLKPDLEQTSGDLSIRDDIIIRLGLEHESVPSHASSFTRAAARLRRLCAWSTRPGAATEPIGVSRHASREKSSFDCE